LLPEQTELEVSDPKNATQHSHIRYAHGFLCTRTSHINQFSASTVCVAQFKSSALRDTLLSKSNDWRSRHHRTSSPLVHQVAEDLDRPGLFVFKHRERQCFQFVGRATVADKSVFNVCSDLLKASFDGTRQAEPQEGLAALMIVSMAADWDFYFISVKPDGAFTYCSFTCLTTSLTSQTRAPSFDRLVTVHHLLTILISMSDGSTCIAMWRRIFLLFIEQQIQV
jgi:hypothetical protein